MLAKDASAPAAAWGEKLGFSIFDEDEVFGRPRGVSLREVSQEVGRWSFMPRRRSEQGIGSCAGFGPRGDAPAHRALTTADTRALTTPAPGSDSRMMSWSKFGASLRRPVRRGVTRTQLFREYFAALAISSPRRVMC